MAQLPPSVYYVEVVADRPVLWWRLGEQADASVVIDEVNQYTGTVHGTPTFQTSGLVTFDPNTAMAINDSATDGASLIMQALPTIPITLEAIYKGGATGFTIAGQTSSAAVGIALTRGVVNPATARVVVSTSATTFLELEGTTSITDLAPHHIAATWSAGGTVQLYVDGVLENSGTLAVGATGAGTFFVGGVAVGSTTLQGTIDEVAVYGSVLSAERIAAHVAARAAPWSGDTTGQRINRILDVIGVPEADRDIDDGVVSLQSADINGQSAGDHIRKVVAAEYGELFATPAGKIRFIDRHSRWKPPYNEPLFTLSDDGSDLGYGRLKFNYDDQLIRNRVTIGYENGVTVTVNSTSSQDDFAVHTFDRTGLLGGNDEDAIGYANYIANRYDEPLLRVEGISITPQRDPDVMWPAVLAADLVYQVNVERTPQGIGSAVDIDYTIEGISHHIEPKFWRTELRLSPADTPGAFILDSTSQGILDTNVLGF